MTEVLLRSRACSVNFKDNLSETSTQSATQLDRQELGERCSGNKIQQMFNAKVKSSLCRNYMERGCCPYGNKCQFAHGASQLKCNSDQHMSYKTRPCHAFVRKGYCSYGSRCNFLHRSNDSEEKCASLLKIRVMIYETRKKKGSRILELGGKQ